MSLIDENPVRVKEWPGWPIVTDAERKAVSRALGGELVSFRASRGPWFLGGPEVQALEEMVADYHDVKHAVSFTSATAALHGAVVACGVEPLDEVVVTPYSFNSSATAPLMHNAIPVFADVTGTDFCLDPDSVREAISPSTSAIIVVHLFGGMADMDAIMEIAEKFGLAVIEDCAQAPGSRYKNRKAGTIGDCGVFSFVGQKNVSCGEGGMLITNDDEIARIARLVRNHADALGEPILGYNYRMTEYQAALAGAQWPKMDECNHHRRILAGYLAEGLSGLPGISILNPRPNDWHSYYVFPILYDEKAVGLSRDKFVEAVNAEGVPVGGGYIKPLNMLPLFEQRAHFAFRAYAERHTREIGQSPSPPYGEGVCPVAEDLWRNRMIITMVTRPPNTFDDMDDVIEAFEKVIDCADQIPTD